METHVEKELQILKSDYNLLKAELKQQKTLNETFLKSLRKRPATAVNKEIKNRMWGDIITIPMIPIICANIHWPMLSGFWYRYGPWPICAPACGYTKSWTCAICSMTMCNR